MSFWLSSDRLSHTWGLRSKWAKGSGKSERAKGPAVYGFLSRDPLRSFSATVECCRQANLLWCTRTWLHQISVRAHVSLTSATP